jgi:tetratricopeptide (TPR) repeat protein
MNRPLVLFCLVSLMLACAPATWREVVTPHFRLDTDLDRAQALRAATALESTRDDLLSAAWPGAALPQSERADVFVFADPLDLEAALGQPASRGPVAYWITGDPPTYLLAGSPDHWESRESLTVDATSILRHGMAAQLTSIIYPHAPRWFTVGLGEFLSTVHRSEDNRTVVLGAVNVEALRSYKAVRTVSLQSVLAWDWKTNTTSDAERIGLTGASWVLFHWLFNDRSQPFARYRAELSNGVASSQAWQIAFPGFDVAASEREMHQFTQHGKYVELTAPLETAPPRLEDHPLDASDLHVLRAKLAQARGRFSKDDSTEATVKAEVSAALALDASNPAALVLDTFSPADQRLSRARAATAAHPDDARAWRLVAEGLAGNACSSTEEENAYRRVLALEARDAEAMHHLSWFMLCKGQKGEALALALRALKLAPAVPAYLDTYARALYAQGACQRATAAELRAVELSEESAAADYRKALSQYQACATAPGAPTRSSRRARR